MPEITLCRYCKQSINKDIDDYVVVRQAAGRFPQEIAHAACEQKRAAPFELDDWIRAFRWPRRS
jgi:hypothetical protein